MGGGVLFHIGSLSEDVNPHFSGWVLDKRQNPRKAHSIALRNDEDENHQPCKRRPD